MGIHKHKNSPYWQYKFEIKGRKFFGSTGTKTKSAANQTLAAKRVEALDEIHHGKRPTMTLDEAAGHYMMHAEGLKSCDDIAYRLGLLVDHLGAHTPLSQITDGKIANYVARRRGTNVKNASVNREVQLLRAVMRRARDQHEADLRDEPKWRKHLLPEPPGRIRCLTDAEENRLFDALRQDWHALVRFALDTGARQMSIMTLRWRDVDFDARQITFQGVKSDTPDLCHTIPMTEALIVLLANLRGHHPEYVFTFEAERTRDGRTAGERCLFTKHGWRRQWRRALERADVTDFRFHDLRHTCGTRLLRATGNLVLVQKLLGHSDISMTARYAHAFNDDVRAGMESVRRNSAVLAPEPQTQKLKIISENKAVW